MTNKFTVWVKFYGEDAKPIDEIDSERLSDHMKVVLYVQNRDPDWNKPEATLFHWSCGRFYLSAVKHLHNQQAWNINNSYTFRDKDWNYYLLENQGSTKPEHVSTVEIPRPKTRVETKYIGGRWVKYLKAKGWVVA